MRNGRGGGGSGFSGSGDTTRSGGAGEGLFERGCACWQERGSRQDVRERAFRALAPGCSIRSKHTQMAGLTTTARASSCQSCPVFLAWMARGSLDYQKQSLGVPDAVQEAKEANREDMDLLKGSSAA